MDLQRIRSEAIPPKEATNIEQEQINSLQLKYNSYKTKGYNPDEKYITTQLNIPIGCKTWITTCKDYVQTIMQELKEDTGREVSIDDIFDKSKITESGKRNYLFGE